MESIAKLSEFSNDGDDLLGYIDKLVEGWNDWTAIVGRGDHENYVNGNVDLLFEHVGCGWDCATEGILGDTLVKPANIPCVLAECHVGSDQGKVGDLPADYFTGKAGVVAYWDQSVMLVHDIHSVNKVEKAVSSRFRVGFERNDGIEKGLAYPLGHSVRYGFTKPVRGFAKGELSGSALAGCFEAGADDGIVGMVKGGTEAVDSSPTMFSDPVYDGFIFLANVVRSPVMVFVSRT